MNKLPNHPQIVTTFKNGKKVGFIGSVHTYNSIVGDSNITATKDCFLFVTNFYSNGGGIYGASVSLDETTVINTVNQNPTCFSPIPVRKGQKISFNNYCVGSYTLYNMLE